MTAHKLRTPDTIEAGVLNAAAALGLGPISDYTEVTESSVYKWTDPDTHSCVSMRNAAKIDALWKKEGFGPGPMSAALKAETEVRLLRLGGAKEHEPGDPLARVCAAIHECGEAVQHYRDAVDGDVSHNQAVRARKEIHEAIEALQKMDRDISAHARLREVEK